MWHCAQGSISVKQLDLADLDNVKRCSHDIAANESRVDGLILNAGIMACPFMQTKQGFELQMGTALACSCLSTWKPCLESPCNEYACLFASSQRAELMTLSL